MHVAVVEVTVVVVAVHVMHVVVAEVTVVQVVVVVKKNNVPHRLAKKIAETG